MKITHQDIADKAGCSRALVTQALHRSRRVRVSPETRRHVLEIAEQMGYEPRGVTTHNIGLVVQEDNLALDVTSNFFHSASRILSENNYRLTLFSYAAHKSESLGQILNAKTVDGVIFLEWESDPIFQELAERVPCVLVIDDPNLKTDLDQVSLDTIETARRAAHSLIERGHRRILLTTGKAGIGFSERLRKGIEKAFYESKIPLKNVAMLPATEEDLERGEFDGALLKILRASHAPTAIISSTPGGAIIILNRLQKAGVQVPEDMSLLCMVDGKALQMLSPTVTTTTALGESVVSEAVKCLLRRIENPHAELERTFLPGEIVERTSVMAI